MRVIPFSTELRVAMGFSHKVIIRAADVALIGGSVSGGLQIFPDVQPKNPASFNDFSLPAGACIARVGFQLITPFAGGALSALNLGLGDGGNAVRYLSYASSDLVTAAANTLNVGASSTPYIFTQADTASGHVNALFASFVATDANFNELTAGQLEIYFELQLLNRLALLGEP